MDRLNEVAFELEYYSNPPYHDPVSSPAYVPVVIQPNSFPEPLFNTVESDGRSLMHNLASAAAANVSEILSNQIFQELLGCTCINSNHLNTAQNDYQACKEVMAESSCLEKEMYFTTGTIAIL
ncbi:hypothetical protein Q3G72_012993 [Acer saccharum]|nr:hypothetical protein Q3G72_012993 [Acer saccharum]